MKIISKWKDYYDYISFLYGIDEKTVYERKKLILPENTTHIKIEQKGLPRTSNVQWSGSDHPNKIFKLVCICAKSYLMISDSSPLKEEWKIYKPGDHPDKIFKYLSKKSWWTKTSYLDNNGVFLESLLEIHKKLNAPVFTMVSDHSGSIAYIDSNIPILGDLGVPAIISSDQIYQELSYFITNIMRSSPDTVVNDNLTNKEKIVSHGFDLKQSFRHRV